MANCSLANVALGDFCYGGGYATVVMSRGKLDDVALGHCHFPAFRCWTFGEIKIIASIRPDH